MRKLLGSLIVMVMLLTGVSFVTKVGVGMVPAYEQSVSVSGLVSVAHAEEAPSPAPAEAKPSSVAKWVEAAKKLIEHGPEHLQGLLALLVALGAVLEALNRLLPTKDQSSALSKIGAWIVKAGEYVKKALDFLKVPNVEKK